MNLTTDLSHFPSPAAFPAPRAPLHALQLLRLTWRGSSASLGSRTWRRAAAAAGGFSAPVGAPEEPPNSVATVGLEAAAQVPWLESEKPRGLKQLLGLDPNLLGSGRQNGQTTQRDVSSDEHPMQNIQLWLSDTLLSTRSYPSSWSKLMSKWSWRSSLLMTCTSPN